MDPEWFASDPTPDPDPTFKEISAPTPDPDPVADPATLVSPWEGCAANSHLIREVFIECKPMLFVTFVNFIREVLFEIHLGLGLPGSGSEKIYPGSDSGSGSGKKFRMRPDPDPQHCMYTEVTPVSLVTMMTKSFLVFHFYIGQALGLDERYRSCTLSTPFLPS